MKTNIYDYTDYKKLLLDLVDHGGRGIRKSLADSIGCQVSHITNVLSGSGHLSAEQAEATGRFFGFNSHEMEFFLLLLQYTRAGSTSLRKTYEKWLIERREKYSNLKTQLKMPDSIRGEQEARYYSSWQYGAIHVLVSIPDFQTRESISKKLKLPIGQIDEALGFLVETGLIKKEGGKLLPNRPLLHLDKTSPLISKHHTNWRLRAIQEMEMSSSDSVHYSSVFTLSVKDYEKVKGTLQKTLSECFKIITASPEEEVAVLCLDLFRMP